MKSLHRTDNNSQQKILKKLKITLDKQIILCYNTKCQEEKNTLLLRKGKIKMFVFMSATLFAMVIATVHLYNENRKLDEKEKALYADIYRMRRIA